MYALKIYLNKTLYLSLFNEKRRVFEQMYHFLSERTIYHLKCEIFCLPKIKIVKFVISNHLKMRICEIRVDKNFITFLNLPTTSQTGYKKKEKKITIDGPM